MKAILKYAALCCLAVFVVAPGFAQVPAADLYKSKCEMCHGADGLGQTAAGKALKAASFSDPAIVNTPDEKLIAIVKKGKNSMPVFGDTLSDDQIKSLVAYLRTLKKT